MADDPVTIAAIERLEEHRQRLIAEKVARNEAVLLPDPMPVIAGSPCKKKLEQLKARQRRDSQGREVYYTGTEPLVIITGVPRSPFPCAECDGSCAVKSEPSTTYLPGARAMASSHEPTPMRKPTPGPELMPPTEWRPVWAQVRGGNGDTDPGMIVEAKYGIGGDGCLYLESLESKPITMRRLNPGEDPKDLARKLMLDHWRSRNASAPAGFYDQPINRPIKTYH